jgi:RNA polymerase sigma-70 factor (ECF subfamily)
MNKVLQRLQVAQEQISSAGKKPRGQSVSCAVTETCESAPNPVDRPVEREDIVGIVEACRTGDREAFRALYDIHKDKVYSIALYFFHGDTTVASDVTQQVFLKLMTSIQHFRGDSEFSTWLHRMVVNACVDSSRRKKSAPAVFDPAKLEMFANKASQEDDLARAQMTNSVRAAISALPPQFRIAILLKHFEDFSYEQMAEALHCSLGTVGSRLSRGHKLLAERLKEFAGGRR